MIVPSPGETCQTCWEVAIGFHPYCGFACQAHLTQAQADFCAIHDGRKYEVFGKIRIAQERERNYRKT